VQKELQLYTRKNRNEGLGVEVMDTKFIYGIIALFIGIIVMSQVGYLLGIFVIPVLIGITGYILYTILKNFKK
jgi:hypothetical protein